MIFVDRRIELDRIETLERVARKGRVSRHVALVGVRRIGKSVILEEYLRRSRAVAASIQIDEATSTPREFADAMSRSLLQAAIRHQGADPLPPSATRTEMAVAAGHLPDKAGSAIARLLDLGNSKSAAPDILRAALALPEAIAEALGAPVIVLADEFQDVLGLASSLRSGRGRPGKAEKDSLLKLWRAATERRPHVGWVVTGSSIRMMQEILGKGPLMGRFDILAVSPLDQDDCRDLVRQIWEEEDVSGQDEAADKVVEVSAGHPFYADVAAREAATTARRLGEDVSPDMVMQGFLGSVHGRNGAVSIACQEMWESVRSHAPALRGLLIELARRGRGTAIELASAIGLASEHAAFEHLADLERLALAVRVGDAEYKLTDHVFRYWLTDVEMISPRPALGDPSEAQRAVRRFEEAFLRESAARGPLVEAYVREIVTSFRGQSLDGKRFGVAGSHVRLPQVQDRPRRIAAEDRLGEVFGHPSEIELDLCFGESELWLGEVKDRTKRATASEVELLSKKAAFLRRELSLPPGREWMISMSGFGRGARQRASELGVLVSAKGDIEAIAAAVTVRRR